MAGSTKADHVTNYVIGSLFPRIPGTNHPNVILSSSLQWQSSGERVVNGAPGGGILDPALSITTNPVTVPGVESFLNNWLIPQVSNQSDAASIFSQYFATVLGTGKKTGKFYSQPLNKTLESLALIGYRGQYFDYADASYGPWASTPKKGDAQSQAILKGLRELSNYQSQQVWGGYKGEQTVKSRYDVDAVLQQIAALDDPSLTPDLWYPSLLYTYGTEANGTSYPGPVLMIEPGDDVALRFSNQLAIDGLTQEQAQKATIIPNSTFGNSASDGLGANTSVNYHLHGSHTFPAGFGDNVVARYTTGQSWTTDLPIPFDHGQGSYWYHPHYHPSVNQQVYSGLSGFMQIGDPLSKIAPLKDVPRNLAVFKTLDVALDADGDIELTGIANLGPVANRMTMNTVNGEFQPEANAGKGGWQAITLSNQANQAFYNIALINHKDGKATRLPFHIKNRLLGHWGSSPGQAFIWTHANRLINKYDLDMIYMSGPGHGAPGMRGPVYIDGSYSERYPDKSLDAEGLRKFFKMFSFPGHIGSHCTAETPGSIHEGGELGYVLSHACGAVFDNPELITVACVGDGEAETGPLATSWHINKFLNPIHDGAVLPVLHLNGYKIANPSILSRIPHEELTSLMHGYGWEPLFVEGSEPMAMHRQMAQAMEQAVLAIRSIQENARRSGDAQRPRWPMIVLRSPKGWTGPAEVDGNKLENFWRSHQVPVGDVKSNPAHLQVLEEWLKSYRPWELFDADGAVKEEIRALAPKGDRRMGSNPHTNGGVLRKALVFPDLNDYAVPVPSPGASETENTVPLGQLIRDLIRRNPHAYRLFGPDETASNRLQAVYEASKKVWMADYLPEDLNGSELARDGAVVEMLSEHTLVGMMDGYLLTGRNAFFHTYEAFAHVIASMYNQHCKWLEHCEEISWRAPIGPWNCLISSTVWRQDHNGFTHQDPGFMDLAGNKKGSITRVYLPADANCLLAVAEQALTEPNVANIIVSDKQKHLQYLGLEEARRHVAKGASIWAWACNDDCGSEPDEPDVVLASAGDIPTKECLAAIEILRERIPQLKVRYVNVVKLFAMANPKDHPHGMSDCDFTSLFTPDKPVIFNFHGYPWLIHRLTYNRPNHANIHVRGYKEQGNINTPLELAIVNQIDRFNLVIDVINRVPSLGSRAAHVKEQMKDEIFRHRAYAYEHGTDAPEINNWRWSLGHSSCTR